jgi:hypothetical protein
VIITPTIRALNSAIARALASARGIARVQDADQLTEGIPDLPLIQVVWTGMESLPADSDRLTFGAGVRPVELTYTVDVYARQRSHIGEDTTAAIAAADAVHQALEYAAHAPCFGLEGARALRWRAERTVFQFGAAVYAGARFTLTVTLW